MSTSEKMKKKLEDSKNEVWGCAKINPKQCRSCHFSHGKPPFEDAPEKVHCMIYSYDDGVGESKPPEVYYDGADCEFYEKDTRK